MQAPSWRNQGPRYDCVFVETDPDKPGFQGLHVARVLLLFSFEYRGLTYPCALIHWFTKTEEAPDELTGMWVVEKEYEADGITPSTAVIHLETLMRAAHLIPVYGAYQLDLYHSHHDTLDTFNSFFVNKFADHHSNEIAF